MWAYYFAHVQAIVFVVDVTDVNRIGVVRDELSIILESAIVKDRRPALLVYANKSDKESSATRSTGVA